MDVLSEHHQQVDYTFEPVRTQIFEVPELLEAEHRAEIDNLAGQGVWERFKVILIDWISSTVALRKHRHGADLH